MKALKTLLFSIPFIVFNIFFIQMLDPVSQVAMGLWLFSISIFIVYIIKEESKSQCPK